MPPPPPQEDWTARVPTEGPLARRSGAEAAPARPVPLYGPPPPSPLKKLTPLIVAAVVLLVVGIAAKLTIFKGSGAPGQEELTEAFTPIPGVTYQEVPEELLNQAREQLSQSSEAAESIESLDMRGLTDAAGPMGAVVIFGVDPERMQDELNTDFTSELTATSGGLLNRSTVAGVPVYSVTLPQGSASIFFDEQDGMIFLVTVTNPAVANTVTEGLIEANI